MVFMSIFAIALIDTRGEDLVALKKKKNGFRFCYCLLLFVVTVVVIRRFIVNISNFTREEMVWPF